MVMFLMVMFTPDDDLPGGDIFFIIGIFIVKSGKCLNSPSLITPSSRGVAKNKKHS